ncbi:hypothetical protein B6P60_22355 [Escherichia coli]|nr:hypothetical protein [Escherichia coli]
MQLRAPWRVVTVEKLTHEQFNNTLPSLATDCASCSRDPFWCRNVLSPSKLREKWDELSLRLSPSVSTYTEKREDPYFKSSYDNVDYSQIPAGFRG